MCLSYPDSLLILGGIKLKPIFIDAQINPVQSLSNTRRKKAGNFYGYVHAWHWQLRRRGSSRHLGLGYGKAAAQPHCQRLCGRGRAAHAGKRHRVLLMGQADDRRPRRDKRDPLGHPCHRDLLRKTAGLRRAGRGAYRKRRLHGAPRGQELDARVAAGLGRAAVV